MRPEDRTLAARDAALPGLSLLLDDAAVASTLRERVPDAGVRGAKSSYIRYKHGTNCLVAFELDTVGGPRLAYGRTEHEDNEPKLRKAHAKARPDAVLVKDEAVVVLLFPSDRRLRSLSKVMQTPATVLAYKPERRLVVRRGTRVLKAYAGDRFVAARDAALPGLSLLLDDAAVASTLREHVPDAGVRGAKSSYIRYKHGTNCLVAFELSLIHI